MKPERKASLVHGRLTPLYPNPKPLLVYGNPFELLVAVILSAQCTDDMVNRTTPALFARWPTPRTLAGADPFELEAIVHPCGFFRSKSAHLRETAGLLIERHGGMVPETMEALTALPGVGRKTANVVRSAAFGLPAIIVDTHFIRVTRRLGLTLSEQPEKIEREVSLLLPESEWTKFSHEINRHGRAVCKARKPECQGCPLLDVCDSRA